MHRLMDPSSLDLAVVYGIDDQILATVRLNARSSNTPDKLGILIAAQYEIEPPYIQKDLTGHHRIFTKCSDPRKPPATMAV